MTDLTLSLDIRDFDLEKLGFSLAVLDGSRQRQSADYLRMTLPELNAFIKALQNAGSEVELTTGEGSSGPSGGRSAAIKEVEDAAEAMRRELRQEGE